MFVNCISIYLALLIFFTDLFLVLPNQCCMQYHWIHYVMCIILSLLSKWLRWNVLNDSDIKSRLLNLLAFVNLLTGFTSVGSPCALFADAAEDFVDTFFEVEVEMEKLVCRDLICTSSKDEEGCLNNSFKRNQVFPNTDIWSVSFYSFM